MAACSGSIARCTAGTAAVSLDHNRKQGMCAPTLMKFSGSSPYFSATLSLASLTTEGSCGIGTCTGCMLSGWEVTAAVHSAACQLCAANHRDQSAHLGREEQQLAVGVLQLELKQEHEGQAAVDLVHELHGSVTRMEHWASAQIREQVGAKPGSGLLVHRLQMSDKRGDGVQPLVGRQSPMQSAVAS